MNRHARITREKGSPDDEHRNSNDNGKSRTDRVETEEAEQEGKNSKGRRKGDGTTKQPSVAKSKTQSAGDTTKKEIVLALLRRKDGATPAEIAKATHWQNHTIRGFISGT